MAARRYQPPSMSALVAFEAVARLKGFGRAAAELNTSQPAVSRHVRQLEARLGAALLDRSGGRVRLTARGEDYYAAVLAALEGLDSAGKSLRAQSEEVTLACTHEVSHLVLLPFYEALSCALGGGVDIRILTSEYVTLEATIDAGADIVLIYGREQRLGDGDVPVMREAIAPLAAPRFREAHAALQTKPDETWADLPLLHLSKPNGGWARWDDWFQRAGLPVPKRGGPSFHNYIYLLEAAVAGRGLALGWRGFVERYLDAGTLVKLTPEWQAGLAFLVARLTPKGQGNTAALRCLDAFRDHWRGRTTRDHGP